MRPSGRSRKPAAGQEMARPWVRTRMPRADIAPRPQDPTTRAPVVHAGRESLPLRVGREKSAAPTLHPRRARIAAAPLPHEPVAWVTTSVRARPDPPAANAQVGQTVAQCSASLVASGAASLHPLRRTPIGKAFYLSTSITSGWNLAMSGRNSFGFAAILATRRFNALVWGSVCHAVTSRSVRCGSAYSHEGQGLKTISGASISAN